MSSKHTIWTLKGETVVAGEAGTSIHIERFAKGVWFNASVLFQVKSFVTFYTYLTCWVIGNTVLDCWTGYHWSHYAIFISIKFIAFVAFVTGTSWVVKVLTILINGLTNWWGIKIVTLSTLCAKVSIGISFSTISCWRGNALSSGLVKSIA